MEECFNTYDFIVENSEILFGFTVGKIVISGDSAGGIICLNIVKHAIRNNKRVPDGVLLYYPCSRVIISNYSPSLLMCLDNSLLDSGILAKAQTILLDLENNDIEYYADDDNLDFYKTKPNVVKAFPKTMIVLASDDPLRDEGYILTDFLLQHGINVKMREYLYYCHGFICLSSLVDPYYQNGEDEGKNFILEVFYKT
jgi:hormone-sensitive lipase